MKKIYIVLLIFCCSLQTTFSQCENPPTGMVSWWTGDMTTLDKIDDNHAVPFNGVSYTAGMVDETLLFDGIDDLAIVFPSPELDTTGDMTVMAWVRRIGYAHSKPYTKKSSYYPALNREIIWGPQRNHNKIYRKI